MTPRTRSFLGFKVFALLVLTVLVHLSGATSSNLNPIASSSSGPLVSRGFDTLKKLSKRSGENQPIVPACITGCIARNALAVPCATDDVECICTNQSWLDGVGSCFGTACGNDTAGIAIGVAYTETYCMTQNIFVGISVPS
ncbi:BQ2448_2174 [Microbotryum intermedium]|uniref:BQ2448_2174 protein n=1 Tax=Microbotryum intermedium TaxID=269621 RepID=A0A238FB80_9BASI|nr:BQ2448_2174 [Microbotryum intermedium]